MRLKNILSIFLLLVATMILSNNKIVSANPAETLTINYYRYKEDYDGWDFWVWPYLPTGGDGSSYSFDSTQDNEDWQTATIDLHSTNLNTSTTVGIIVKKNGWSERDISKDRHIDLSMPDIDGNVNIYLIQGSEEIYYRENDADKSHKILSARFTAQTNISFQGTKDGITATDVSLTEDDENVLISDFSVTGTSGSFTIPSIVDLTKQYILEIDFGDAFVAQYLVTFDGIYDSDAFEDAFTYDGGDLGAKHSSTSTTFKLWAPISTAVDLLIYENGTPVSTDSDIGDDTSIAHPMTKGNKGVWLVTVDGNLHGKYYTFNVTNGIYTNEVVDPYVQSTGVNGLRGMIVDFEELNPVNWANMSIPEFSGNYTDAIIYELHVRDLTTHSSWNGAEEHRGKFLGLIEEGTTYKGFTTGMDHIKELGISHIHLLPTYDFGVVDETRLDDPSYHNEKPGLFNWGYMPLHFNTPEGSYSTNPYDGAIRVTEFKKMVHGYAKNNIRVIMDVVYNHTGHSAESNFYQIIPGYYHRMTSSGGFSNGSGTGNETASERSMFRNFMIDSVKFWAEEYNVKGFRFDLMKLHDIETMNQLTDALHVIDPTIMVYGEPWDAGGSALDPNIAAGVENIKQMPNIAAFNDDFRDGIKGSVFNADDKGYIHGDLSLKDRVMLGVVGGIDFPEISRDSWGLNPTQSINYVSAHDNHTLFDKNAAALGTDNARTIAKYQKQANAIVLTSQGVPFIHAGAELMRTKNGDHNSYEAPDSVNQIDWNWKVDNIEVFNYYKGLITIRNNHVAFRASTSDEVKNTVTFPSDLNNNYILSYQIKSDIDTWKDILVIHNVATTKKVITLPKTDDRWIPVVNYEFAGIVQINDERFNEVAFFIEPNETIILYSGVSKPISDDPTSSDTTMLIIIGLVALVGVSVTAVWFIKKR